VAQGGDVGAGVTDAIGRLGPRGLVGIHTNLLVPALNDPSSLPAETDEEKEIVATLDREHPLKDLDDAIEELVVSVADLCDLTEQRRYAVETIRRATPKLGRNDPCHCGSGRKYKQCHGAN